MKKIIFALFTVIIMLNFTSCTRETEGYSIRDALKISMWVFDETIDGNDYRAEDAVYTFEQLKLNEVKILPPYNRSTIDGGFYSFMNMSGLNIFVEFDGVIEVVAEDEYFRLSRNKNLTPLYMDMETREMDTSKIVLGYSAEFAIQGFINALPVYTEKNRHQIPTNIPKGGSGPEGTETYLSINAYKFDSEEVPVIRARLKLIVFYSPAHPEFNHEHPYDFYDWSLWESIELISYEYSEIYKFMDDIWDDEDYD